MTFKVRKSGTFSDPAAVKRKNSGAWTNVGFVKVMKSGVWEQVWPRITVSIEDITILSGSFANRAVITLDNNGTVVIEDDIGSTMGNWLLLGSAGDCEARATITYTNGTGTTVGTFGSWLNLSSPRTWGVDAISGSSGTREFTLEIREVSSGSILDTATIYTDDNAI